MSASLAESNIIIVSTLGSVGSFDGYAQATVLPALEDVGLDGVHIAGDSSLCISEHYVEYQQEVAAGLDRFSSALPRAAGVLILNSLPGYQTGMQTTHKEALRAHASLWIVQAAMARALEVPRFAIDLSVNGKDEGETLLRMQLRALGTVGIQGDFEKILDVLDPPI